MVGLFHYIAFSARKTSARRPPPDEGCATSYRLKRGPLPPNEVIMIARQFQRGRRMERRSCNQSFICIYNFLARKPNESQCLLDCWPHMSKNKKKRSSRQYPDDM